MKKRGVVLVSVLVSLLLTAGGFARSAQAADCEGAWAYGRIPFSGTHWGWYILFNYCFPTVPGQNCGTYSTVMFAGQSVIVANVVLAIFHDPDEPNFSLGNSLHVRISPIDGYLLEDVRTWVSLSPSFGGSPLPKNPSPGKFPYQLDPNELGAFDALIPLTDVAPPNTQLYVAIHAEACGVFPEPAQ
jgi:hypothetical protein